jgi:hypothetical protein
MEKQKQTLERNARESTQTALIATFSIIFFLALIVVALLFTQTESKVFYQGEYSWGDKIPPWKTAVITGLILLGVSIILSFWRCANKNTKEYFKNLQ